MVRLPGMLAAIRSVLPPRSAADTGRLHHAILGLMLFVGEQLSILIREEAPSHADPARSARNYLDAHYSERISVAELARHSGVTPAHLGRAFHRRYGTSPGRYRDQLRMEAAVDPAAGGEKLLLCCCCCGRERRGEY